MHRWKNRLFNISFALNCLLLFLLIFENRLAVPAWLQVAGRMHPLVLHFPVVLILLYALCMTVLTFRKEKSTELSQVTDILLGLAALSSVITALAGLFLSREEGYDAEALQWHKWSGTAISFFTLAWYYFSRQVEAKKILSVVTSIAAVILITFAGHQGAGITHGQNFLLAPMLPEKKSIVVSPEEAIVFAHMVKPILEAKCESCHNSNKAKGELVMESKELLLKGGKSGALWDTAAADLGLFLRRVHLPLEAKKHMPPQGKPQLTDEEIEIITLWIRKGADFDLRVADLPEPDTLRQLANTILKKAEMAEYDFDEADPSDVSKLNTANRIVVAESLGSPALSVNFFNSQLFNIGQVKELSKVKKQVVTLDLARMPVKDEDIRFIAEFENLRRLNLGFTSITGSSLSELKKLKFLRSLSLSGTKVDAQQLKALQDFPELQTVYAWNTAASPGDIAKLQLESKDTRYESGFRGDTMTLKLSMPVLLNEDRIITQAVPLKLKHYINGTTIRYTTDGTDPDSISSPVFKGGEMIDSAVQLKAKAYKAGWLSSDIIEASFMKNTYTADSVIYLTKPNERYRDDKGTVLINHEKGEADFRFGGWVAYRENRMECLLPFEKPATIKSVTLSTLIDIGSYIMPAQSVEIWGGETANSLSLLGKITPQQPDKSKPAYTKGLETKFPATSVKYIKIIATPLAKLPSWHPGKGDKGWLFVDEVLVN